MVVFVVIQLFYFVLLVSFPILVVITINLIVNQIELNEDWKHIFPVLKNIVKFFSIIIFIDFLLSNSEINLKSMFLNIVYFSIFFIWIIFINYFSTRYYKFKICIKLFLDAFMNFVNNNFVLNLLFIILLVFVKNKDSLMIGLIGSYFFFALTSICDKYKESINDENRDFKKLYEIMQMVLNFVLLKAFVGIEKMISNCLTDEFVIIEKGYSMWVIIFGAIICLNFFLPQIENFRLKNKRQ